MHKQVYLLPICKRRLPVWVMNLQKWKELQGLVNGKGGGGGWMDGGVSVSVKAVAQMHQLVGGHPVVECAPPSLRPLLPPRSLAA